MRVLHAYKVFRPDIDGGVVSVIALACTMMGAGIFNSILFARGRLGFGRKYDFGGVPGRAVLSLGTLFGMPIAPGFPAALWSAAQDADIVALHLPFPLNDLGALSIGSGVGLVVHWHSEIHGREFLSRAVQPFIRRTLDKADRIIVSNEAIILNSPLLLPHRTKCEVVPFGVDPEKWDPRLASTEQRMKVSRLEEKHARRIVAMGRLVSYKGFDVLLRALTEVDAHLTIIGTGAKRISLEQLASELGVSDRVTFSGYLTNDDVKTQLWAAQVFAFPSNSNAETFGIAQLEAMAAGLPIVNTWLDTAVPLVARDGMEALTVPPNDPKALSEALSRLLDDEVLAKKFGLAGKSRVREEFRGSRFVERLQKIYQDVYVSVRQRRRDRRAKRAS